MSTQDQGQTEDRGRLFSRPYATRIFGSSDTGSHLHTCAGWVGRFSHASPFWTKSFGTPAGLSWRAGPRSGVSAKTARREIGSTASQAATIEAVRCSCGFTLSYIHTIHPRAACVCALAMLHRHWSPCFGLWLPRPAALDLDHQRPAQEGANQNQKAQDGDALQSSLQGHGTHNIGRDQDLQA